MSQVLFGQSYFLRFDPKLWKNMQPYPPLGSMYAASYLRQQGYEVALFDAMLADSEEDWAQALEKHHPRFAVLYEDNFNYLSKMCLLRMRQAAHRMIAMAKYGHPGESPVVILCGADATDHYADYLSQGADYILIGEGEETLNELLKTLLSEEPESRNGSLRQIRGLAYMEDGRPVRNERRPDLRNLDALPFPAWDLIDVERYRSIWQERHGYFSMNLVTTRGCPFHCNWCAKPIWGQRYNSRSPENVAAEMRWLKDSYHPDHLWFADDIFGLKPGWISRLAEQVQLQDASVPFKCLSRVDLLLRPGEVEALKKAGARIVWVGAESGSQKILDAMDKGTRVEQIAQAARCLRENGLQVGFFLQFGYPGEGWDDIQQTLQMVRDCLPDDIGISVSYPMPGTKFFDNVQQQLGEKQNWQDSGDLAMLYQGPYSTAFYRKLHQVVHREFRARKAWQALKAAPTQEASPIQKNRPSALRLAARLAYNALALPFARWQLRRLAVQGSPSFRLLPHMPHEAAASPTPQDEP